MLGKLFRGSKLPSGQKPNNNETDEKESLRNQKGGLRLRRCKVVKKAYLLEGLNDGDKSVEVKCSYCRDDVNGSPQPNHPIEVECGESKSQYDKGYYANNVGRPEALRME